MQGSMTTHRTPDQIAIRGLAAALALLALAPAAANAGPLLSGYGGPGQGNQAILGSTLLGGPGGGSSGAGAGSGSGAPAIVPSSGAATPTRASGGSSGPRRASRGAAHAQSA